jgi:hypothetical protein
MERNHYTSELSAYSCTPPLPLLRASALSALSALSAYL